MMRTIASISFIFDCVPLNQWMNVIFPDNLSIQWMEKEEVRFSLPNLLTRKAPCVSCFCFSCQTGVVLFWTICWIQLMMPGGSLVLHGEISIFTSASDIPGSYEWLSVRCLIEKEPLMNACMPHPNSCRQENNSLSICYIQMTCLLDTLLLCLTSDYYPKCCLPVMTLSGPLLSGVNIHNFPSFT